MAKERSHGTGESGVRVMAEDRYFTIMSVEMVETAITYLCGYYEVCEPAIELISTRRRWKGVYHVEDKLVQVSHLYEGLVLHELAHHIARERFGRIASHGREYATVLQEMHDLWE